MRGSDACSLLLAGTIPSRLQIWPLSCSALNNSVWREGRMAKEDRGFASMDRSKQREIASQGGRAAHAKGTAHEWTSEEAREAGRKGGLASRSRHGQVLGQQGSEESQVVMS